jgi:hypothetical protein
VRGERDKQEVDRQAEREGDRTSLQSIIERYETRRRKKRGENGSIRKSERDNEIIVQQKKRMIRYIHQVYSSNGDQIHLSRVSAF